MPSLLLSCFLPSPQAIEQLVGVYREAPLDVRATTFASVVSGLGRCMEVRRLGGRGGWGAVPQSLALGNA